MAGPPAQPPPFPLSPDPWRQSPRQPQSPGGWGEGDQLLLPFVSLSLALVSSSFPRLPLGAFLHCLLCGPLPISSVTLLLPHFPLLALFLGLLSSPVWSLCFCLQFPPLLVPDFSVLAWAGGALPRLQILLTLPLPNPAWTHSSARSWPTTPTSASARARAAWPLICPSLGLGTFLGVAGEVLVTEGVSWGQGPSPPLFCPGGWLCTPHPGSHRCLCT